MYVQRLKPCSCKKVETYDSGCGDRTECFEGSGNHTCLYTNMNGCGFCEKFDPIWKEFTTGENKYKGPVKCVKKERSEAKEEIEKYGIQGFPTIMMIDPSGVKKEELSYEDRNLEGLKKFCENYEN